MFEHFWRTLKVYTRPSEVNATEFRQFYVFLCILFLIRQVKRAKFASRISGDSVECVRTTELVIDWQVGIDARTHAIHRSRTELN